MYYKKHIGRRIETRKLELSFRIAPVESATTSHVTLLMQSIMYTYIRPITPQNKYISIYTHTYLLLQSHSNTKILWNKLENRKPQSTSNFAGLQ